MSAFSMEMPPAMSGDSQDAVQLRKYIARLVERLLYALNSIDDSNLTPGSISLDKLKGGAVGVANATAANIGTAKMGRAEMAHLNAQVAEIVTGVIKTAVIDWAKVTDMEVEKAYVNALQAAYASVSSLNAGIANIADARIAEAEIGQAHIEDLKAYAASIVQAEIQTAEIDWAKLKHMVADEAIVARFVGDRMYIDRLGVTSAQMVDLTVGTLCVKAADNNYYTLDVDPTTGYVTATQTSVSAAEISAGITSTGQHIVETTLTANELSASNISAVEALIGKITAEKISVDQLFARQAVINAITTGTIAGILGASLNLSSNTSIIANVKATQDWADLQGDVDSAAEIGTQAQQALTAYTAETDNTLSILQDGINARVTSTQYNTNNQIVSDRIGAVELRTTGVETSVQNLQDGIGTHFVVKEDYIQITQDQTGDWEQQLYADSMQFVNRTSGKVAASFGVSGGYADRLRSNKTLSVGQTDTGWYDMTSLESGVADKWRDGTSTVLRTIITEEPTDSLLTYTSGSHPITGSTSWPETAGFSCSADNATGYQWQYRYGPQDSWRTISGATGRTLTGVAVNANSIGMEYRCRITGAGGSSLYTRTVRIRFKDGPAVITQPESVEASLNESVTLSVKAIGASLQWQHKDAETDAWTNVTNATNASLTVTAMSGTDYYRCVLTDANGRVAASNECIVEV